MKVKSVAEVKAHFSECLDVEKGPVVISRNGRPAAVLVPVPEDSDVEDLALTFSPRFREMMARAEEQIRRKETFSQAEALEWLQTRSTSRPRSRRTS